MIDLHTHSLFSDGVLLPTELIRRAAVAGYRAIAITDHVDISNIDFVIPRLIKACRDVDGKFGIRAVPGVEITHVPPEDIKKLVLEARGLGAQIILVHGETISEPVAPGTNIAALEADIDILAHPGLITEDEVMTAVRRGIALEITCRKGHSLTNGHVARLALRHGAKVVVNTDAHEPGDLVSVDKARRVLLGAGWPEDRLADAMHTSAALIDKCSFS